MLGRSLQASRFKVFLWVASVTLPGPALMRGSRLFWCSAAACLQVTWAGFLRGVGATYSGCSHASHGWCQGGWRPGLVVKVYVVMEVRSCVAWR